MIPSLFYAVGVRKSLDVHLWYKKREKRFVVIQRRLLVTGCMGYPPEPSEGKVSGGTLVLASGRFFALDKPE